MLSMATAGAPGPPGTASSGPAALEGAAGARWLSRQGGEGPGTKARIPGLQAPKKPLSWKARPAVLAEPLKLLPRVTQVCGLSLWGPSPPGTERSQNKPLWELLDLYPGFRKLLQ